MGKSFDPFIERMLVSKSGRKADQDVEEKLDLDVSSSLLSVNDIKIGFFKFSMKDQVILLRDLSRLLKRRLISKGQKKFLDIFDSFIEVLESIEGEIDE